MKGREVPHMHQYKDITNNCYYNSICMVTSLLLSDLRKFFISDLTIMFYVHINIFKKITFYTFMSYKSILLYEGESNENLRSAIKIRNNALLSCKLATVILMV